MERAINALLPCVGSTTCLGFFVFFVLFFVLFFFNQYGDNHFVSGSQVLIGLAARRGKSLNESGSGIH